jgi:hypothetical protein
MAIGMGIILIFIFLVMMVLMYLNKISALLALPIMAILFTIVAGVPNIPWSEINQKYSEVKVHSPVISQAWQVEAEKNYQDKNYVLWIQSKWASTQAKFNHWLFLRDYMADCDLLKVVLYKGALRLNEAYTLAFFGGMLAIFVRKKGIAEAVIRIAAELAGDRPVIVAIVLMLVCAALFVTLGGLGAVIMIGTIIFPIMLSLGTPPVVAAGVMLIGICAGGSLNPTGWVFFQEGLGVPMGTTAIFSVKLTVCYLICGVLFIIFGMRKGNMRHYWAMQQPDEEVKIFKKVSVPAMLTPLVPLILILIFSWPALPAFLAGLIWGLLTTWERNQIKIFSQSLFEGAESVMPAVLLMIGIGMLLNAVTLKTVSGYLEPILTNIIPSTRTGYILIFTLLAPLALYRGPLNVWGMGLGLATLFMKTGKLSAAAIMGMLISVGAIQGVCDPTNTANVWIAGYVGVDVLSITKKLMPYIWVLSAVGLVIAAFSYM